jgi:hypothetical protein
MSAALPKDIDEIEERVEEYKRYERVGGIAGGYFVLWYLLSITLYAVFRPIIFPTPFSQFELLVPILVASVIPLLVMRFADKGMKKYHLEDDEWVTYYANSVFESLEDYAGSKNKELKKDSRKEALEKAERFLSYVKKRWSYGRFKLATDYFGDSIGEFKKNLQFRLIPSIEDGDDEMLTKTGRIMYNLLWGNLSVDTIKRLNTQMVEILPNREPLKMGMRNRLSNFLIVHKTMRDGLAVILSSAVAIAFYSLAIYFQWASRDYAFAGSVAIFIGLLTIYFTKLRKTD